jgi:hypothetical protein
VGQQIDLTTRAAVIAGAAFGLAAPAGAMAPPMLPPGEPAPAGRFEVTVRHAAAAPAKGRVVVGYTLKNLTDGPWIRRRRPCSTCATSRTAGAPLKPPPPGRAWRRVKPPNCRPCSPWPVRPRLDTGDRRSAHELDDPPLIAQAGEDVFEQDAVAAGEPADSATLLTGVNLDVATVSSLTGSNGYNSQDINGLLGTGLIPHSQKSTVAARATADRKTVGHRSYRVATLR